MILCFIDRTVKTERQIPVPDSTKTGRKKEKYSVGFLSVTGFSFTGFAWLSEGVKLTKQRTCCEYSYIGPVSRVRGRAQAGLELATEGDCEFEITFRVPLSIGLADK